MFDSMLNNLVVKGSEKYYVLTGRGGYFSFGWKFYIIRGRPKYPRKLKKRIIGTRRIRKKHNIK